MAAPPLTVWLPLDLLQFELDTAFDIHAWRSRRTWQHEVNRLLSSHPLHDISIVVPILVVFTLPFAGYCLLWCCFTSFFLCFVLDKVFRAYTPRMLDPRIIALSHVSPRGFPCFELTLAAAVCVSLSYVRAQGSLCHSLPPNRRHE